MIIRMLDSMPPGLRKGIIVGLAIEGAFLLAGWAIYLCFFFGEVS